MKKVLILAVLAVSLLEANAMRDACTKVLYYPDQSFTRAEKEAYVTMMSIAENYYLTEDKGYKNMDHSNCLHRACKEALKDNSKRSFSTKYRKAMHYNAKR